MSGEGSVIALINALKRSLARNNASQDEIEEK